MATYTPPKRATAYTTYVALVSQADTDIWQTSVTLAAGDVQVSKDGGSFANIATLPTEIGTSGVLAVALSAAEMTADTVTVRFHDAAGDEWCDALIVLHTSAAEIDDIATNVWAYSSRTLTQSAASVASAVSGSTITIKRGDSLSASLTGLGDISSASKLWFTVKAAYEDADADAIIQIDDDTGLLYLNGEAAATAANGSITVDDDAAGDITIALDETETDDLAISRSRVYDVQMLDSSGNVSTLTEGVCVVTGDVTRAVV